MHRVTLQTIQHNHAEQRIKDISWPLSSCHVDESELGTARGNKELLVSARMHRRFNVMELDDWILAHH